MTARKRHLHRYAYVEALTFLAACLGVGGVIGAAVSGVRIALHR